jgi:hypothetical protein
MPRYTSEITGDYVIVTDNTEGTTYTFAASLGEDFFRNLLFDMNVDDVAEQERNMVLTEHGVEVG